MKHDVLELRSADLASRGSLWFKEKLLPAAKNSPLLTAAVLFSLLASIYWFFIASDRYVSEAHVIIQRRSEEHTSELQSLMRISYADFCLKKKQQKQQTK